MDRNLEKQVEEMYVQEMTTILLRLDIFSLEFPLTFIALFQNLARGCYIKAKISRLYLTANGTSVPSERVFSTAEYVSYREIPLSFHPYYQVSQTSINRFCFKG